MSKDMLVSLIWSGTSAIFVLLAVYGIQISSQEDKDTRDELRLQAERRIPNGILILGLQQASAARFLKWCHKFAFVHQSLGLLVGLASIYYLLIGTPGVDTPTTDLGPVQEYFVPIAFIVMLFVICAVQLNFINITRTQRKARLELRALEMAEGDEFRRVADDIARRIAAFQREFRAEHVRRGREQDERGKGQDERGKEQDRRRRDVEP